MVTGFPSLLAQGLDLPLKNVHSTVTKNIVQKYQVFRVPETSL